MTFRREKDVRQTIRRWAGGRAFWIEHGAGGTVGLPDAILCLPQGTAFCELKMGKIRGGTLLFKLRPAQAIVCKRLISYGARVAILVGAVETKRIFAFSPVKIIRGPVQISGLFERGEGVELKSSVDLEPGGALEAVLSVSRMQPKEAL